ncbi:hypothetical protein CAEBREN_00321 [Caenorhabditis brenneri]|uniref:Uncharacterized protein n=1 Tax=Caenorhabditis brenneri TaxID=135651 RepID=G0NB95_CAEBE|nr:hypothetical protein CAEBREN_00321 [Caenorhabditis brenneri]
MWTYSDKLITYPSSSASACQIHAFPTVEYHVSVGHFVVHYAEVEREECVFSLLLPCCWPEVASHLTNTSNSLFIAHYCSSSAPTSSQTPKFKAPRLKVEPTMDVLSEVILWEFTPVEPLCNNGGVKELVRVASPIISGFSSVGWVPAILPSYTLGTVCNSTSSFFIACDGVQLIIYQAVLDARGLLSELSNAKAACHNRDTLDKIVISDDDEASDSNPMSSVIDRSQSPFFKDKFFIVLVDQKETEDIIMMFSLTIFSQTLQKKIHNFDTEALSGEKGFLRPSNPLAPSMANLNFDTEL